MNGKESKLMEHTRISISLASGKGGFSPFSPLFLKGFIVKTTAGISIKDLLTEKLKVEANYLEERIKTIFLDGKPVDDADKALVKDGSIIALSAAMPGLVGSTFRRGGALAVFRSDITYKEEEGMAQQHGDAMVTIKLFNLLITELSSGFLKEGIWLKKEDFDDLLKERCHLLSSVINLVEKDGREMPFEKLAALNWSGEPDHVFLMVRA